MAFEGPFPIPAEQSIASYNYADIISGMGIIELYGGHASGAYVLTNFAFASDPISTWGAHPVGSGTYLLASSAIYEAVINKPIAINGNVLITTTGGWESTGADTIRNYVSSELFKVDINGTETSLGSNNSSDRYITAGSSFKTIAMCIPITNQLIKAGEKIKLKISLYLNRTAGSGTIYSGWGQDPLDRNDDATPSGIGDTYTKQLKLLLPVKINL